MMTVFERVQALMQAGYVNTSNASAIERAMTAAVDAATESMHEELLISRRRASSRSYLIVRLEKNRIALQALVEQLATTLRRLGHDYLSEGHVAQCEPCRELSFRQAWKDDGEDYQ